jgi:integrase
MANRRRRFGWVYSRPNAHGGVTWYAQWQEPVPGAARGRRVTRAIGAKKAAEDFLAEIERRFLSESYTRPQTVAAAEGAGAEAKPAAVESFVDYAERVLEKRIAKEIRDKTLELYRGNLRALRGFFGERTVQADDGTERKVPARRLDEITAAAFLDYRAWRRTACRWRHGATVVERDADGRIVSKRPREVANSTINRDHHFCALVLGHAVVDGLIAANPLARVHGAGGHDRGVKKLRESEGRRCALSKGEAASLILACGPELRPLVLAALFTGCRRGELLSLKWRDVDFDREKLEVFRPKDQSHDVLDMHPALAEELGRLKKMRKDKAEPDDAVFLNSYGRPWCDFRRAWRKALKGAKLAGRPGLVFHAMRHTFATHFLENGGAVTDLRAQLGHSKLETTQRYAELVNTRRRDTIRALDFGSKRKRRPAADRDDAQAASG